MLNQKSLGHFLSLMPTPICLCDGTMPSFFYEEAMERALIGLRIPFDMAYNLYDPPEFVDLTQYPTISFGTRDDFLSTKTRKIFSFDRKNLRCIVAQSKQAWELCREESKEQGVVVIGFDPHFHNRFDSVPRETIFDHPFFFPDTDPHPKMWKW